MSNIERCECGGFFRIEDSRPLLGGQARHRRRKCTCCGKTIYTKETETPDGLKRTEWKLLDESKEYDAEETGEA